MQMFCQWAISFVIVAQCLGDISKEIDGYSKHKDMAKAIGCATGSVLFRATIAVVFYGAGCFSCLMGTP